MKKVLIIILIIIVAIILLGFWLGLDQEPDFLDKFTPAPEKEIKDVEYIKYLNGKG